MGGAVPVTDGRTIRDLAAELGFFLCRYASLRARILPAADGGVTQAVSESGVAVLGVLDVDHVSAGDVRVLMLDLESLLVESVFKP